MKSTICTILVGIVFVIAFGLSIQNELQKQEIITLEARLDDCRAVIKEQADHVLTKREFQRQLQTLGYYKSEIDGNWGRQSNKAWDLAIGDQSAERYFDPNTYRKAKK